MKHYDKIIDTEGTCADCGKNYASFRPCDCDMKELDDVRLAELKPTQISIAVVTDHDGDQEVVRTATISSLVQDSDVIRQFLEGNPGIRPRREFQHEYVFKAGEDEVSVNFFKVDNPSKGDIEFLIDLAYRAMNDGLTSDGEDARLGELKEKYA